MHLGSHEQYLTLPFLIFQDELLKIAVGYYAQSIAEEVESQFICGELEVGLSTKTEANLPFFHTFDFIRA